MLKTTTRARSHGFLLTLKVQTLHHDRDKKNYIYLMNFSEYKLLKIDSLPENNLRC